MVGVYVVALTVKCNDKKTIFNEEMLRQSSSNFIRCTQCQSRCRYTSEQEIISSSVCVSTMK
jgi:hypothetical protein